MAQSANMDASELARDIAAGLASATTATERAALVPAELVEAIQQLKTQRDAVILAHYYVAPEVQAVADHWRRQCAPQYEVDFTEWGTSLAENAKASSAPASGPGSSDEESLYAEAVAFVQEQGRMSISLLQRRFRIGFNKAARFVERMEEEGILPPASRANKARTVRMD